MWGATLLLALAVQAVPAILALAYQRPGKATLYLATLPFLWFMALELISGHAVVVALTLLLAYPLPWAFLLRVMHLRREQLQRERSATEVGATRSAAP